ncbi:MAG: TonB-dependent receptor [Sphingorhabdus sp.]
MIKTALFLATAVSALVPSLARAQEAQQPTDIIVTGQKRDTTLQDSDVSVTVLDEEAIRETRLRDVRRIDDLVPNVQFNESGQLSSVFVSIRGVESNPFIVNRAAIYIDGIPFRELSNAVLNQVQSIEVLRGPQSTLYGANSEAGLILINTRQPKDRFEGEVRGTAMTFNGNGGYGVDGFVGGPIAGDTLKGSLAFKAAKEDAYIRNPASSIGEPGKVRDLFLQGRLTWEPSDALSVRATAYILDTKAPGLFDQEYAPRDRALYDATYGAFNNGRRVGRFEFLNDAPKLTEERNYVAGLSATYKLGYGKIDAALSYSDEAKNSRGIDLDLTALTTGAGQDVEAEKVWSGELRFTSPDSEAFQYLVGASWYRESKTQQLGTLIGPGDLDDYKLAPPQFNKGEDFAVFGSATVGLGIEGLSLTGGLRYDRAKRQTRQQAGVLDLGFVQLIFQDLALRSTFDALLPRAALTYKPSDNLTLFASAARGYIPGGFNLTAAQQQVADEVVRFDKESIWSYETGFKARFAGGRGYLNGAAFYLRSNNWQEVQVRTNAQGQIQSSAFISATASIDSKGFEVEGGYEPVDGLKLTASFGYADAKYRDFQISPTENLRGNRVKLVPRFDANAAVRYETPDGLFVRAELSATGKTPLNERSTAVRGTIGIVNLQAGYESERFSLRLFADNVTNRRVETGLAFENFSFGSDGNFYAPFDAPRILGVEAEVRF